MVSGKIFDELDKANILLSYINIHHKGKSIDHLTLNHMMFLEDTQQFPNDASTVLSNDIEKCFDRTTTETQDYPRHGYAK